MNLKEKWAKQNNSVKLLLRKLRRHDTFVVAIAVVIAMILCGGLIYFSTPVVTATAREELEESERANNEKTIEKLDELSDYLDGLDKSITDSKDSISSYYEKAGKDTALAGEKNTEKITNNVNEKVTGLGNNLTTLHETITNTKSEVERLKETIEKEGQDNNKERAEMLSKIEGELDLIKSQQSKAQEETQGLIKEIEGLSEDMAKQYQELLAKLTESEKKMSEQNSSAIENFKTDINKLNQELTAILVQMNTNVDEMGEKLSLDIDGVNTGINGVNTSINGVNTNINSRFDSMNLEFQGDFDELKTYLDEEHATINDNLKKVFQSVSDGKKYLASALLTKNVVIREDAKFREIAEAIRSIPTTIVLDKDNVPGKVEYICHYHVDGEGKECDEEMVSIERQGGCYTAPVYHQHTGSCYTVSYSYVYETDGRITSQTPTGEEQGGEPVFRFKCSQCGQSFTGTNSWHHESSTSREQASKRGNIIKTNTNKVLKCKIKPGTVTGYKTGCNMVHGQVVGAYITFKEGYENYNHRTELKPGSSTVPDPSVSHMMVPVGNSNLFEEFGDELLDLENYSGDAILSEETDAGKEALDMADDASLEAHEGKEEGVFGKKEEGGADVAPDNTTSSDSGNEDTLRDNIEDLENDDPGETESTSGKEPEEANEGDGRSNEGAGENSFNEVGVANDDNGAQNS